MAIQTINIGAGAGDTTAESAFSAFGKVNSNFADHAAALASNSASIASVAASLSSSLTPVVDAGATVDLTAAIAACIALGQATLRLRKYDYTWPSGTLIPLGMNIVGEGFDATHAASTGVGSKISVSDGSVLVQALGASRSSVIQGVNFATGLQVRKQHTTLIGCRTDGNGLIVGDNTTSVSPYYSRFIAHRFEAAVGGTSIQLRNLCNACTFDGALFMPQNGRGIDFQGSVVGNTFTLSQDYSAGMASDYGAIVYFSGAGVNNEIDFLYWEDTAFTGHYLDGGHFYFGNGASRNRIRASASAGGSIRSYQTQTDRDNYVSILSTQESVYKNSAFSWDYSYPNEVMLGSGTGVNLPPKTYRRGPLKLYPTTAATSAHAAYSLSAVAINAIGSGGTSGTYYQQISDANTVAGQAATVQIVVNSGVMTAVTLLYPGWWTVTPSTSFAVTAATGLVGGTLTLTVLTDNLTEVGNDNDYVLVDKECTTFIADAANSDWRTFPPSPFKFGTASVTLGTNGNATIAHGLTRAPTWANATILGDLGGTDVHIEIQALDATNITLRGSTSAGTDVTTGTYTVRWACK